MHELLRTSSKVYWVIIVSISLILLLIKITLGLGYIIGIATSTLSMKLLITQIDQMFFYKKFNAWIGIPLYILKSFLFTLPMTISIVWPQWVNLYAVVAGLLSPKFIFYIQEFIFKKETL